MKEFGRFMSVTATAVTAGATVGYAIGILYAAWKAAA